MIIRRCAFTVAVLFALTGLSVCHGMGTAVPADKVGLRILYAGHPGSAREKDFVGFLGKHFTEVQTGDLAKFTEKQADGFDVVILDYDGDGFKAPRPKLSTQYTRPTVTVGVIGAFICGSLGLKSGYL